MLWRAPSLLTTKAKSRSSPAVIACSLAAATCAAEWEPKLVLPTAGDAQSVIWSTNGNVLITGHGGVLKYWQMPEGRYLKTEPGGPLAVLANGEREIAVSMGLGAELRRIDTGEVLHRIELPTDPNQYQMGPVAFSPDGQYAAFARVASSDPVRVIEFSTGATVKELDAGFITHPRAVFSPDSKWLAGMFNEDWSDVWRTSDWERTARREVDGVVAAFSPSGERVAIGFMPKRLPGAIGTGPVTLVSFEPLGGGNVQWMQGGPEDYFVTATRAVAWSRNGAVLASANNGLELHVFGAGFGLFPKRRLGGIGNTLSGHGMAFSPDGQELAIADDLVELWNIGTGEGRRLAPVNSLYDYSVSMDGAQIAVVDNLVPAQVLSLSNQSIIKTLPADQRTIQTVAFSPRTNVVVAGGNYIGFQRPTVLAWRVGTEDPPSELPGSNPTTGLRFSADGHWVLALGPEGSRAAKLTDALTFEDIASFPSARYGDISPDGSLVVQATFNGGFGGPGLITVYERSTREAKWYTWGNSNQVQVVRFSPDGTKVAAAGGASYTQPVQPLDSDITVFDSTSGELIARLRGHSGEVSSLVFAADSEHLISSSTLDRTIRVWKISEEKQVRTLLNDQWGAGHLQLTPGGRSLFYIRGDGNVMSLDLTGAFVEVPRLEVQKDNGIVLRWSARGATVLERSISLGAGANWVEETNVTSKGDGNFEFAVPSGGEAGFFRLRQ